MSLPTVQHLSAEAQNSAGKWTLALLNVDEMPELREALSLEKVPVLFHVNKGFTVQSKN